MRASVKPKCVRKKAGGRLPRPICPDRRGMANPKHHGLRWQGAARHRYRPRQGCPQASQPSITRRHSSVFPNFRCSLFAAHHDHAAPSKHPRSGALPQDAPRHSTVPRTRQRLGMRWPATAFPLRANNRNALPPVVLISPSAKTGGLPRPVCQDLRCTRSWRTRMCQLFNGTRKAPCQYRPSNRNTFHFSTGRGRDENFTNEKSSHFAP